MKNSNFSQGATGKSSKIYDTISQTMIELLESLKTNPERWERPWILSENGLGAHNAQTKRHYSGINQIYLSYLCLRNNYSFNRWLTFKQVHDLGGRVKKDQRAAIIVFSKKIQLLENQTGKKQNETEEERGEETLKPRIKFMLNYYNVFNVDQCEGIGEGFSLPYDKTDLEFNPIDSAEEIIKNSGAVINYSEQEKAFYTGGLDLISLPLRKQFKSVTGFYQTVFHELGHWTGHRDRLNRKLFNMFGSEDYAREELTAEMCSVFVNSLCGIDVKIKQSAAYIESWLMAIKEDKTAFIRSTMQAQTAANYILERSGMEHLKHQPQEEKQPEPETVAA
jgi:putative DNA primase/helicase